MKSVVQKETWRNSLTEELIIKHCAPTLAGLKTGNLFTCSYETEKALRREIRELNDVLVPKGIRILPMRFSLKRALIYVYRPNLLKKDLKDQSAGKLLQSRGYICGRPELCVVQLAKRLQMQSEFPHEIGLFLGYPPEDVWGFIENKADCSKCRGCWKVYGDENKAKKLFARYKKCTDIYCRQWTKGTPVERLTVTA
jgi:hypothetical protein